MGQFAITRADGTVDLAEGESIADVRDRYGWPGNGDIQPYNPAFHPVVRGKFNNPGDQEEFFRQTAENYHAKDGKVYNSGGSV